MTNNIRPNEEIVDYSYGDSSHPNFTQEQSAAPANSQQIPAPSPETNLEENSNNQQEASSKIHKNVNLDSDSTYSNQIEENLNLLQQKEETSPQLQKEDLIINEPYPIEESLEVMSPNEIENEQPKQELVTPFYLSSALWDKMPDQKLSPEHFQMLNQELFFLSKQIQNEIFAKTEPFKSLNRLNYLLDAHFENVWQLINTPINEQIQEEEYNPKIFFYQKVLAPITEMLMNEIAIEQPHYMNEILIFFYIIISKFLARDPLTIQLIDIASQIFNWDKSFHLSVCSKFSHDLTMRFDFQKSEDQERLHNEFEWRKNKLKVGDYVDVLREQKVRELNLKGWTRGIVKFKGIPEQLKSQQDFDRWDYEEQQKYISNESVILVIDFDKSSEASSIKLSLNDWRIAPLGTFTDDYDWRETLSEMDTIDCMDNERDWYKATVLQTRNTINDKGVEVKEIFVGFRYYDKDGSKQEDDGRKFFGWSERYDEWYSSGDIQVQRYRKLTYQYIKVESANKQYEKQDFDDREDIIFQSKQITNYVSLRANIFMRSKIINKALNLFGRRGGFNQICSLLEQASRGEIAVTLPQIFSYVIFMYNTQPLWHRQFLCSFVDRLNNAILSSLSYVNTEANDSNKKTLIIGPCQVDTFDYKMLENMINIYVQPIWRRYNTKEMDNKILGYYQLEIGTAMLKLQNLQRRICGLKYIAEAIRTSRNTYIMNKLLFAQEVIEVIRRNQILQQVFGEGTHFQLVHRSLEIIRILFFEKEIMIEEVDLIWSATEKQGEQIKLEVYQILLEVLKPTYLNISDQVLFHLIGKFENKEPSTLIEKDLVIMNELSNKSSVGFKKSEQVQMKCAQFMWKIATREFDYPLSLIKQARKNFQQLTETIDDQAREPYIAQCLDNITQNKLPLQSLKILRKLVQKMNLTSYNKTKRDRQEFVQDLVVSQEIINIIIDDLESYIEIANGQIQKGEITTENYKTKNVSSNHIFPHIKNIKSRLSRIRNLLLFAGMPLTSEQISRIWDLLIQKSLFKEQDQNLFFNWLKILLEKESKKIMPQQLLIELFRSKIVCCDISLLKHLRVNGLDCIVTLFVMVNELKGNVLDLDTSQQESNWNNNSQGRNYNYNYQTSNTNNKSRLNRFRINILPQDLEGIGILWSMMEASDNANYNLFFMVQRTLINIYTNLSGLIADKTSSIHNAFIQQCFHLLTSIIENQVVSRTQKQRKEAISFVCKTISTFFESTESKGLGDLRTHRQLQKRDYLTKLIFETKIPIIKYIDANFIEVNCHNNLSIWELKLLLAQFTSSSPLSIGFKRSNANKPEIKDHNNSKTLFDLMLEDQEQIHIVRYKEQEIVEFPLVDKQGKMVPELKQIIKAWFIKFSEPITKIEFFQNIRLAIQEQNFKQSEGAQFIEEEEFIKKLQDLDDNLRIMYPKNCALFVEAITNVRDIAVNDYRVVNLFSNYSHRVGFSILLEQEFLGFYEDQAKNKPDTVRSNLENYGIQADLKQKIDHNSLNFENDSRVVRDKSILPRCKLASDQDLFEQLLNLVNRSQCDEFEGIWSMIMSIQTNPGLFESVLSLNKFDELFSLPLLDKSLVAAILEGLNIYKILYTIQILKSLIEEYKSKNQDFAVLYIEQRPVQQLDQIQENPGQVPPINTKLYDREFPGLNVADIDSPDIYNEGGQAINHELNYNNSYNAKGLTRAEDEDTEGAEGESYITSLPSNQAIPLPYHGPLAPQTTYDIPLAPQSAASQIGAPNSSNTQTYYTSLSDFKGQTIRVGIQNQINHSPQDLERIKNFLPQFLKIGGLSMLIKLFMGLARFNSQLSQDLSKQINERILKICLSEIMEIIKELLTAQFCASQKTLQEINDIEKNLPIKNKVVDKKNDKKEKVNQFLEDMQTTEKAMRPLIIFLQRNRQDFIPQFSGQFEVELPSFQKELLGVVYDFISKEKTESEDIDIVKQGLNIWLSCLSTQPQLIKEVLHFNGNDSKFSNMLIEKGLLSSDYKVRDVFHYAIMYICQNLQEITLQSSSDTNQSFTLITFFLNLLIQKIEYICAKRLSKHTRRFFELLIFILEKTFEIEYQDINSIQQLSIDQQQFSLRRNASQLVKEIVNQLLDYQSTETRNSVIEDYTLGGFFNVTRILLSNCPQALEDHHLTELAEMLLNKCLFCFDFKAMPTHITAEIDLEPFEKSNLSKCLTSQSTQACFNLLITICKIKQDKNLIFGFLTDYWHKIIYKVDKPNKPGFYPAQNGRSLHGYCGLYNLGAVCYMNSMNQQFYAVPQLRYGLMAAEDQQPENKVLTDLGYEVDDNALHQLQKIFGFLQLSDRQYRNPLDFCFSFKQFDGQPTNVREQRDAQEFLSQVFDRLDTQLKNTSQKYLLANVFGGKTCSMLRCTNCGNLRQTLEDFYNLSLEVKNQSSVQESLRKFIQGEIISDYNCEACKKKVELEKKVCIEQSPNTLIIHLQRIIFDYDSLRNVKLNDRVEFPEVLNLYEFTTSQVLQNTKRMKKMNSQTQNQENENQEDHKKNDDDGIITENNPKKEEERQLSEEENQSENEEEIAEGKKDQKKLTEEDFEYRLVGVICHMGSAEAGHYISYVNVERDQDFAKGQTKEVSRDEFKDTKTQKWLEFNDSTVSIFKASTQLEQTCFGSIGNNQNAYMLVYEKRMKQKMKLVVPNQLVQWAYLYDQAHPKVRDELAALACDGTAIPRDHSEILQSAIVSFAQTYPQAPGTHLLHAFPKVLILSLKHASTTLQQQQLFKNQNQIQDLSDQDFYYDSKNDEIIAKIDFFDTRKFIPNHIYKDVHEDNLKFLSEKQVFQNGFYECTLELAKMALDHVNSTPQLLQDPGERSNRIDLIFGILERVVFDLLVNSKQNQSLKAATNLFIELLDQSDDAIFYLIKKRIFVQKEMLMKDERDFFETLATHQNQEVREMASTILQFVIKKLVQIGGVTNLEICKQALTSLLDLMPNECSKHWLRLDTYFNFFYNILNMSPLILHLMLQLRAPARLIDLISRYNSNQMVYNQTVPPFDKLVLSLSFMIRSIPCLVDPYDSNNFVKILKQFESDQNQYPDRETLIQIATENRIQISGTSNLNIPLSNTYGLPNDEVVFNQEGQQDQLLQLSSECQRGIFYKTKESKVFLENMTKNTYEIQELAKMFAHLCFENKEFSQRIAKYILKGTNTSSAEELAPYLEIMKQFLILKDSLIMFRLELIFGLSHFIIKTQSYQQYGSVNGLKSGVAGIDNIYGSITKYFSPAFKTTGVSQYGGKDCAMQALINNKRSQSKAVLYSLKCIFECILDHNHLELLQYLRTMDPPSYQFARYWDWIKIWVANEVDSNTKNQKLPAFFNELELSITVLNQIEQIENLQNIKTGANYNEGVITYPQDDPGPKPYIIWEIQSADILDRQGDDQYNIRVQVNQVCCKVSKSFPIGDNNLALLDTFRSGYMNNSSIMGQASQGTMQGAQVNLQFGSKSIDQRTNTNNQHRVKRSHGRGIRSRNVTNSQRVQNLLQAEQKSQKTSSTKQGQEKINSDENYGNNSDADSENVSEDEDGNLKEQKLKKSKNEGKSGQKSVSFADNATIEDKGLGAKRSDYKIQDDQINSYGHTDSQEDEELLASIEEGPQKEQGEDEQYEQNGQDQENPYLQENQDQLQMQPQQVLLCFEAENLASYTQKIQLNIRSKGTANFRVPVSSLVCEIYAHKTQSIIHLVKLDPWVDSWGDFEWDFQILNKKHQLDNDQIYNVYNQASDVDVGMRNDAMIDELDDNAEKDCPACTYKNPSHYTNCEICQTLL